MARDIKMLHPELQEIITKFISECTKKGFKVGIGECLRTTEEQNALYAQGRTTAGRIVTNASGTSYSSMHQWGVAFDVYRNDGKGAYDDSGNFFYNVGQIGKSLGLFWGGDFKSITDKPHFQMKKFSPDGTTKYLKDTYKTPSQFMKTWDKTKETTTINTKEVKKEVKVNPYKKPIDTLKLGDKGEGVKWLQWELNEDEAKLNIDGDFGKSTETAVKQFQREHKLTCDGVVGDATKSKLVANK